MTANFYFLGSVGEKVSYPVADECLNSECREEGYERLKYDMTLLWICTHDHMLLFYFFYQTPTVCP